MNSCDFCDSLALAPRRFDIPHNLRQMHPVTLDADGHKRVSEYECVRCTSVWRWRSDGGWSEPAGERRARARDPTRPTIDDAADVDPADADSADVAKPKKPMHGGPIGRVRAAARRVISWYHRQGQDRSSPRNRALAGYRVRRFGSARGWRRCMRRAQRSPRRGDR